MNRRTALSYVAAMAGTGAASASAAATAAIANAAEVTPRKGPGLLADAHRASFIERADGTALFFRDWGAGKPIVFVASAGLNSAMWAYQMVPMMQAGYRCVAFDRRGHGRSSDPGRGYDFDTLADDLATVIEMLELRELTLVGHSMGCGEIVRYLTRHGSGRVARIALLAPTTPFLLKTADNPNGIDRAFFEKLRATWLLDYPRWLAENSRAFVMPDTSEQLIQWGTILSLQTSMQAVIECNVAVTETDFRSELPRIDRPTLIVHGTADKSAWLDLTGRPTARLIPRSELKVYENAPHGLFLTHVERVNADLLRFTHS